MAGFVTLFLLLVSFTSYSQCVGGGVTLSIQNFTQTSTTIEYDIWMTNSGTTTLKLSAYAGNILYNANMLPAGATGTLTVVDHPSQTTYPGIALTTINPAHVAATRQLRWTFSPLITPAAAAPELPGGVSQKFCRFRFTSTLPWTASFAGNLRFSTVSTGGVSLNTVNAYCNTNVAVTSFTLANSNLTLSTGNAQQTPFSFILNPPSCPTAAAASNLVAESPCAGAANGSALITVTGAANPNSAVTYTVDGGAVQNATMSGGTFTVSGLSAGDHVVAVTYPTCAPVSTSSFTIGAGAPLTTNGSVITSICAGDTYVWPANGQSYTTAQEGTTFVSGCNTAKLNLTITPATTNGSVNTSICEGQTYVWPANGQSYTTAQSGVTVVSGCNTATLNLAVNPSTTTGSESVSACGSSYTWATSGATYTESGSYAFVDGCNTATLTLTLSPSTTNGGLTTSACDTFTWTGALASGDTYTTSGVYTHVMGCNTATLNLTITPSTTNGSVNTAICAGGTYVWPANGQSYTTAQSGVTFVSGCNTATLNLTVNPTTTNGSDTVTACGSYTWTGEFASGVTYTTSGVYTHVTGCNTATLNLTINASAQTFYADADGDNFGAGAPILSCTGQPDGTSTNNTDCAPADPLRWRTANFFVDADNDGYNNGFPATSVCYGATTPSGFVAVNNGVDCNEENASVNPNASEVLGNGIDDNCDGTTDEVTPLSSLVPASCGVTLTNLSNLLYAIPVTASANVQAYRFRVSNGANVRTFDSPVSSFSLSQLPGGVLFATTYTVEVSVKSGGFFRAYGPSCTVTTQATPTAAVITSPACGSTLANIFNTIFCSQVSGASGYRFRVRNGATVVGTVDRTVNRFSLVDLGINNIAFGTTYTVDVLLAFGGNLRPESEYGQACTISTPATPGLSRVIQPSCGSTINNRWTTIYAQQVLGAQGYKFVVTNGVQTREIERPVSNFALQQLAGGAAANTTYTIRVDVLYNSSYVVGTQLCTITTSPAMTRQTDVALDIYEVSAYPNPYAETFKLNVNTSSEDQVSVQVYDMLGRQVEARQASVAAITNLEIGSQYPSGVYNIIVTQGSNVKTVRVVKR